MSWPAARQKKCSATTRWPGQSGRAVRIVAGMSGDTGVPVSDRGRPARGGSCPRSRPAAWPGRRPAGLADQAGQQLVGGVQTPQDGEDRLLLTREQRRNPHRGGQGDNAALYLGGVGGSGVGHGQLPRAEVSTRSPSQAPRTVNGTRRSTPACRSRGLPAPSRYGAGPVLDDPLGHVLASGPRRTGGPLSLDPPVRRHLAVSTHREYQAVVAQPYPAARSLSPVYFAGRPFVGGPAVTGHRGIRSGPVLGRGARSPRSPGTPRTRRRRARRSCARTGRASRSPR